MSIQTTMAEAAARDAEGVWEQHRKSCVRCARAVHHRRWTELCADGAGMRDLKLELRKAAQHEAWLDKQPSPDQRALFSEEEARSARVDRPPGKQDGGPPGPPPSAPTPAASHGAEVASMVAQGPDIGVGADISGQPLDQVHAAYTKWFGAGYDIGALDAVLCTGATRTMAGDPPWLLVVGGSGVAKTETIVPLASTEGAHQVSTLSGEAALLSGTNRKECAKDATGGLLRKIGASGVLVIKDFTSILSMNRDTRALVLGALREIHDGHWSRHIGGEGGRTLEWDGRLIVVGGCTTVWDAAHQVISVMGDRFLIVRPRLPDRRAAGMQAIGNVASETTMKAELADTVGKAFASITETEQKLTRAEQEKVLDLADLISRARSPVERDYKGEPLFAHALEAPTRLSKQLVQLARGGLALGMDRRSAMAVVGRCAADTMPPMRLRVLLDVAAHQDSGTSDVVRRLQVPRKTIDRTLQELQLLGLLVVDQAGTHWIYSLAGDVSRSALEKLAGNVSTPSQAAGR